MFKKFHNNKYNRGVTLIELLVVIAILAIMSATTLVSYSKFRSTMSIQNLADDIALSVRKAQGYAIGVVDNYSGSYGVRFTRQVSNTNNPNIGTKKSFVLFANVNLNLNYEYGSEVCGSPNSSNECLEILNITSADEIKSITYGEYTQGGGYQKNDVPPTGSVDIFFTRPNPEPVFCYKSDYRFNSCNKDTSIAYVKIQVENITNLGTYRTVTIWNNGQISVN